ncbi:MAG: NAD(+)/NADH kinase [Chloroflexota bacterium]|nr:NAD(+)/NADH kinase [Chloroflexota bacterium]
MTSSTITGFVYNTKQVDSKKMVEFLVTSLNLRTSSWISSADDLAECQSQFEGTSVVVVAGGDGTILKTVKEIAPFGIPLVGVNMGRVGFMSELKVDEAHLKLSEYLDGSCRLETRMMLSVTVSSPENGIITSPVHALNDVVVARGQSVRLLDISTAVDGVPLTTYRADGVIVATPTGSTGYALSAGGSILYPEANLIEVQPIAAHTGLREGVVLPAGSKVELSIQNNEDGVLSVDSHSEEFLSIGSTVVVEKSPYVAKFLRASDSSAFYSQVTRHLGLTDR